MRQPNHPGNALLMKAMQPVLGTQAQREADRLTIESFGLPGVVLMETAGRGVASHIEHLLGTVAGKQVDILAGKGNNGGDGYVIGRVLHSRGARVRIWAMGTADEMPPDAAHHRRLVEEMACHTSDEELPIHPLTGSVSFRTDLCVDALLGTGLSRPLRPNLRSVVEYLNAQRAPVVAVDIPTGLHADTGEVLGAAVRAQSTVTMAALKPGLLLNEGPDHAGSIKTVDIGIPPHVFSEVVGKHGGIWLTTDAGVRALIPERPGDVHKYSAGMALVIGGSPGLTGAAIMASRAAARVGAGYVTCATSESVYPILASRFTATTTIALPEETPGNLASVPNHPALEGTLRKAGAVLVGPGLGRGRGTQLFVRDFLRKSSKPAVIDADGLNSWIGHTKELSSHSQGRWIFTPHSGELDRLTGNADRTNRIESARKWAKRWNVVLVAKGMPSLVAAPSGEVFICGSGNSALATAGSGDVLAGMCVGLLAQGLTPINAAVAALHLGGRCADHYCRDRSGRAMTATDMIAVVAQVLKGIVL